MTICPYKLVVIGFTVVLAMLVAYYPEVIDGSGDEDKAKDGKQKGKAKPQAQGLRGWVESAGDWCSERLISARLAHPRAYRVGYFSCIGALVLFHFEIFTGGYVCRKLFAKTNGTAAAALIDDIVEPLAA